MTYENHAVDYRGSGAIRSNRFFVKREQLARELSLDPLKPL